MFTAMEGQQGRMHLHASMGWAPCAASGHPSICPGTVNDTGPSSTTCHHYALPHALPIHDAPLPHAPADTQGSQFQQHLVAELQKVSQHYSATASQLEQQLLRLSQSCACRSGLSALRAEIKDLQKYVALNYLAVVKAIKKRNRHLKGG